MSRTSKEQQLATLAHELRNPLTPLRNAVELVRQLAPANPALTRIADMMSRQVGQLVQLVDELVGAEPPFSPEMTGSPVLAKSSALKILVADDNSDAADSLSMWRQSQGHLVRTVGNGRHAVEVAEAFRPDVILMDGAQGHRGRPGNPSAAIGGGRPHCRDDGPGDRSLKDGGHGKAGMNVHLVKPVDPSGFAEVLWGS